MRSRSGTLLARLVLVVGLLAGATVATASYGAERAVSRAEADDKAEALADGLRSAVEARLTVLRGFEGLFGASDRVGLGEFVSYAVGVDVPGGDVRYALFVGRVEAANATAFSDRMDDDQPGYHVQAGGGPVLAPVAYAVGGDAPAPGTDLLAGDRAGAYEAAWTTGRPGLGRVGGALHELVLPFVGAGEEGWMVLGLDGDALVAAVALQHPGRTASVHFEAGPGRGLSMHGATWSVDVPPGTVAPWRSLGLGATLASLGLAAFALISRSQAAEARAHAAVDKATTALQGRNRQLEDAMDLLETAESQRDRFFDVSMALLAVVSDEGRFLERNPAWQEQLGWPPTRWGMESLLERVVPEDHDGVTLALAGALTEGEHRRLEARVYDAQGRERWLRWTFVADPDGEQVAVSALDVTQERDAMAALETARARAEAAERAKGAFLANMSHEIRTPLHAVLGMADLLADEARDPQTRAGLETIHRSGEHLLRLLNDVLDLSKMEADRLELEEVPVRVKDLVASVAAVCGPQARQKGLELDTLVGEGVPEAVVGDPTRLRQVLVNLVGNAVKFTEEGHVTVAVTVDDDRLLLAVEDTGPGIDARNQQRVFEAFAQEDASVARRHGGTGLGLAISNDLVTRMGGRIHLASVLGRGTTFTVELPLHPTDAPPVDEAAPRFDGAMADRVPLRILAADDHEVNRVVLERMLRRLGYDPVMVDDGAAVLERAEAEADAGRPFDVVLMDVQMPAMDGPTAARALRARPDAPVVVATTAHTDAAEWARCREAGMALRLPKPIAPGRLKDVLVQAARLRGEDGEADAADGVAQDASVADLDDRDVRELREVFRQDAAPDLEALGADDAETVRRAAHRIRGAAATVGLEDVARAAEAIEVAARAGNLPSLEARRRLRERVL